MQVLGWAAPARVEGADRAMHGGRALPVPVHLPPRRVGVEAPDAVDMLDSGVVEQAPAPPIEAVGGAGVGPEEHSLAVRLAAVGADVEGGHGRRSGEPEDGNGDQRCGTPAHGPKVERDKAGIFDIFLARTNASGRPMLHNPASMIRRGGIALAAFAAVAAFALPAVSASAATRPPTLQLGRPKRRELLDKVTATGTVRAATGGENVTVLVTASGNT